MSLATLARKTRAKQKLRKRGKFILNMTGRGNVLGMNAKMSRGNCGGKLTKCAGKRSACCVGVGGESECCQFPHGGKPAPQMGYGVYLNRKSKGAYHPGGGPQCCTKPNATSGKIVWKQGPSISASEMIQQRKDKSIACWKQRYIKKYSIKNIDKFQSEPNVVKWYWNDDINYWKQRVGKCLDVIIEVDSSKLYKYEMKVGNNGGEYGFDGVGVKFGELCPNKQVLGYTIKTLRYKTGATSPPFKFAIDTTNKENPKRCDIKNIYLVDKDSQRYSKKYSIKNSDKFQDTGNVVKWYWNDDINYWKQREGKCLDVIIEVEKTSEKTKPCAVKTISCGNNLSGRNATDLVSYTRINHVSCGTTKTLPYSSSGDQIAFRRATSGCPKYGLASFKRPMNTYKQKL